MKKSLLVFVVTIPLFTVLNWLGDRSISDDLFNIIALSFYMIVLIGIDYFALEDCGVDEGNYSSRHKTVLNYDAFYNATKYITETRVCFYHQKYIDYSLKNFWSCVRNRKMTYGMYATIGFVFSFALVAFSEENYVHLPTTSVWIMCFLTTVCFLVFFYNDFSDQFPSKKIHYFPYPEDTPDEYIKTRYYYALSDTLKDTDDSTLYPEGFIDFAIKTKRNVNSIEDWVEFKKTLLPIDFSRKENSHITYPKQEDWEILKSSVRDDKELQKIISYIQIIETKTSERFSDDITNFIQNKYSTHTNSSVEGLLALVISLTDIPILIGFVTSISCKLDVTLVAFSIVYAISSLLYIAV